MLQLKALESSAPNYSLVNLLFDFNVAKTWVVVYSTNKVKLRLSSSMTMLLWTDWGLAWILLLGQNALKWSSTIFKTLFNKAYLALTKLRELRSPSPSQIITSPTRATENSPRTPKQQRGEKLLPAIFSAKLLCIMSCLTQDHSKKWKVSTCVLFCSFPPTNTGCVTNKKKSCRKKLSQELEETLLIFALFWFTPARHDFWVQRDFHPK